MRAYLLILALVLGLELGATSGEESGARSDLASSHVSRLISQLGSKQFQDREAATRALDALGRDAADKLRNAMQAKNPEALHQAQKWAEQLVAALGVASQENDVEIRRRAEELARQAQRRIEAVKLLAPKQVHLAYKDRPLGEAVVDFAKQTGFPIQLVSQRSNAARAKITLDTGTTTFWEALDQFCRTAGLVEAPVAMANEQTVRVGNGGAQIQAVLIGSPYNAPSSGSDGRAINLVEGTPPTLPSCCSGPVRFRALAASAGAWTRAKGETLFVLEVTPQPKMAWLGVVDLHIDKAVDDQRQSLAPAVGGDAAGTTATVGRNGVIVWDSEMSQAFDPRQLPVRLKSADRPSKSLKEIQGSVAAQVQTPVQALITFDNILNSTGKTAKGPDGEVLKVIEVKREESGAVKVRLQIDDRQQEFVARMNGRIVGRGGLGRKGIPAAVMREPINPATSLELLDAKGQSFQPAGIGYEMVANGNGLSQEIHLTYRPNEKQAEPAKLVYSGRRTVVVEVPFTLRDVPLP
jgi:hypothetical protein